jgi:hypothetical protein
VPWGRFSGGHCDFRKCDSLGMLIIKISTSKHVYM